MISLNAYGWFCFNWGYPKSFASTLLLVSFNLMLISGLSAQDLDFKDLPAKDIAMKFYQKDSGASALVLREFGTLTFGKESPFPLIHRYHNITKIFKSDGFSYGDIKISLYKWNDGSTEVIKKFKAIVYTPDGNGGFNSVVTNEQEAHYTNESKNYQTFRIALPNLSVGCIIEYWYDLETPYRGDYTPWLFQDAIPKLYSEYQVHMPKGFNYGILLKGFKTLVKNDLIKSPGCGEHDKSWHCSKLIYAMDSIPAFVPEERMTMSLNYISALHFKAVSYVAETRKNRRIIATWKDLDAQLLDVDAFGGQLKEEKFFKSKLKNIIIAGKDTFGTARSVYNYINHHIKWDNRYGPHSATGVRKALSLGKGNIGDINIALINALRAYNIPAEPVIISTKENGQITKGYPTMSEFNYLLAKVDINKRTYLLDASNPMLPFGMVPESCLNDQGRVIRNRDTSYWIDLRSDFKKSTTYTADFVIGADGSVNGSVKNFSTGYDALSKRMQVKNFTSVDEYLDEFGTSINNAKVLKASIENLDSLNVAIYENFDVSLNKLSVGANNQILFNPYILNRLNENPFKLRERSYPIDCGPPMEQRYILTLELPENYSIESLPDPVALMLPNDGGSFKTNYNSSGHKLIYSHIVRLNQSVYMPEEYPYLRELFNKIVQTQKLDIVLKKK